MSNWIDIFRLKKFTFVVVEIANSKDRQKIAQKHKSSWAESLFPILPENIEYEIFKSGDFVKKYGQVLKAFMGNNDDKFLITDQLVLDAIVKNEQKDNFLNFLIKRNKKIIVLAEVGTSSLFERHQDITFVMSEEMFLQRTEFEKSSKLIKERMAKVYNPFSNPKDTYLKMKSDSLKGL